MKKYSYFVDDVCVCFGEIVGVVVSECFFEIVFVQIRLVFVAFGFNDIVFFVDDIIGVIKFVIFFDFDDVIDIFDMLLYVISDFFIVGEEVDIFIEELSSVDIEVFFGIRFEKIEGEIFYIFFRKNVFIEFHFLAIEIIVVFVFVVFVVFVAFDESVACDVSEAGEEGVYDFFEDVEVDDEVVGGVFVFGVVDVDGEVELDVVELDLAGAVAEQQRHEQDAVDPVFVHEVHVAVLPVRDLEVQVRVDPQHLRQVEEVVVRLQVLVNVVLDVRHHEVVPNHAVQKLRHHVLDDVRRLFGA